MKHINGKMGPCQGSAELLYGKKTLVLWKKRGDGERRGEGKGNPS